ncbi:MAG: hypothetical protein HAW58_02270 [Candidatus Thioglobus sp.]|nr:hypothetical protein [Candidatus Thioglobus sp.]
MEITIGMRDLVRDSSIFNHYDYVNIEDKRSHKYKGLLVGATHAAAVKAFLDKNIAAERQKKLDAIMSIAGTLTIDPKFDNLSGREIRMKIAQEKYGESK